MAYIVIFSSFHIRHVCDIADVETNRHAPQNRCGCYVKHAAQLQGYSYYSEAPLLFSTNTLAFIV